MANDEQTGGLERDLLEGLLTGTVTVGLETDVLDFLLVAGVSVNYWGAPAYKSSTSESAREQVRQVCAERRAHGPHHSDESRVVGALQRSYGSRYRTLGELRTELLARHLPGMGFGTLAALNRLLVAHGVEEFYYATSGRNHQVERRYGVRAPPPEIDPVMCSSGRSLLERAMSSRTVPRVRSLDCGFAAVDGDSLDGVFAQEHHVGTNTDVMHFLLLSGVGYFDTVEYRSSRRDDLRVRAQTLYAQRNPTVADRARSGHRYNRIRDWYRSGEIHTVGELFDYARNLGRRGRGICELIEVNVDLNPEMVKCTMR